MRTVARALPATNDENAFAETFAADDQFLRRILPWHYDPTTGRVSPRAFANGRDTNRMSVNWSALSPVEDTLREYPDFGVASLSAELCWSLDQQIEKTPVETNPAHCDVVREKPEPVKRRFRDNARYLRYPSPPGVTPKA